MTSADCLLDGFRGANVTETDCENTTNALILISMASVDLIIPDTTSVTDVNDNVHALPPIVTDSFLTNIEAAPMSEKKSLNNQADSVLWYHCGDIVWIACDEYQMLLCWNHSKRWHSFFCVWKLFPALLPPLPPLSSPSPTISPSVSS